MANNTVNISEQVFLSIIWDFLQKIFLKVVLLSCWKSIYSTLLAIDKMIAPLHNSPWIHDCFYFHSLCETISHSLRKICISLIKTDIGFLQIWLLVLWTFEFFSKYPLAFCICIGGERGGGMHITTFLVVIFMSNTFICFVF